MFVARFYWEEPEDSMVYNLLQKYRADIISKSSRISLSEELPSELSGAGKYNPDSLVVRVDIPIIEDYTFETKSNFQDMKEILSNVPLLGKVMDLFQTLNTVQSGFGGTTNESIEYMKMQAWAETEPFKMNIKGVLDVKNDPFLNSYLPAMILMNQNILSLVPSADGKTNKLFTPGINVKDLAFIREQRKKNNSSSNNTGTNTFSSSTNQTNKLDSKNQESDQIKNMLSTGSNKVLRNFQVVTHNINGELIKILDVSPCMIESAKPTFSKDQTQRGYPIWSEIEIQVMSVYSVTDSMFSFDPEAGLSTNSVVGGFASKAKSSLSKFANSSFR